MNILVGWESSPETETLELMLNVGGHEATICNEPTQYEAALQATDWDVVLLSLSFPSLETSIEAFDATKSSLPGIPIVEATMTRELTGAVDIWCPQVHKYQQNRSFFDERKAAGDQVWVYTCLVPGGPWVNRLLDQERLRQVWIGWAAAKWELDGFLHWGLNHYKADPFAQSVVDHPAMPNTTNKLPAGDTHIVYPGPYGPWSSTRFEAHRIGLEDLAMLRMLQALALTRDTI